jgi:hypothetical protein
MKKTPAFLILLALMGAGCTSRPATESPFQYRAQTESQDPLDHYDETSDTEDDSAIEDETIENASDTSFESEDEITLLENL